MSTRPHKLPAVPRGKLPRTREVAGSPARVTQMQDPAIDRNATISARLLAWHDQHGRSDLPWQHPRTPYRVWLSEIMLQQTQVAVVREYFLRFVSALPDLPALAAAPLDHVLALWSGLGYYSRARNLHASAQLCVERHAGELPRDLDALLALPGIGRSTAGAILSQAWGDRTPILDGNVKRMLCRLFGIDGWPGTPAVEKQLWAIADTLLPRERLADWTQAQMDFGATLCTRAQPACPRCPLQDACVARREDRIKQLPAPKPRKRIPQRETHMLLITNDEGRVLLHRRPPVGVWASLWSLPEHARIEDARRWFEQHIEGDFSRARALPDLDHGFSHFRLRIHAKQLAAHGPRPAIGDGMELRWVDHAELATLGLPAPVRKLLQQSGVFVEPAR